MTDLSTSTEFHNLALQRLVKMATVAAYLAIVAVSICPGDYRPKTGLIPGPMEHLFAYLVLGLLAAWATRRRLRPLWLAAFNAILAGGLELLQNFSPHRGLSVLDFSASAVGSAIGIAVMIMVLRGLRPAVLSAHQLALAKSFAARRVTSASEISPSATRASTHRLES